MSEILFSYNYDNSSFEQNFCSRKLINKIFFGTNDKLIEKDDCVMLSQGVIYNNIPYENNSLEIIINFYKTDQLYKLDGEYSFVLYDKSKDKIIIGRDPFGTYSLYYFEDSNKIIVSSSLKYFKMKNVLEFPINSYSQNICPIQFLNLTSTYDKKVINDSPEKAMNTLSSLLSQSLLKRISNSKEPVAILCSGGIDSVILALLAYDMGIKNITLFTISSEHSYDEQFVKLLIESLDLNIIFVPFEKEKAIKYFDNMSLLFESYNPNVIKSGVISYLLAKYIRENTQFKVLISGDGADELFFGHPHFSFEKIEESNEESIRMIKNLHYFDLLKMQKSFNLNGLNVTFPYLDRYVVNYIINLNPLFKTSNFRFNIEGVNNFYHQEALSEDEKQTYRPIYTDMAIDSNIEKRFLRNTFRELFIKYNINPKILNRSRDPMITSVCSDWNDYLLKNFFIKKLEIFDTIDIDGKFKKEKEYFLKNFQYSIVQVPEEIKDIRKIKIIQSDIIDTSKIKMEEVNSIFNSRQIQNNIDLRDKGFTNESVVKDSNRELLNDIFKEEFKEVKKVTEDDFKKMMEMRNREVFFP